MDTSPPQRIAVIGGGITGLAAAHRLWELLPHEGPSPAVTLYEAADRIGGVFGTEVVGDYCLERGADMFITDKPWALDLCERLSIDHELIAPEPRYRKSLILSAGRPVPTPEAFNLMVPGKLWPVLTTPLLSPWGKLRLMCEPLIPRRKAAAGDDESLAHFVRRRLGREALDRIVQPLVGGIYTGDPEKLSLAATLPRFLDMEQQLGSLTRGMWRSSAEPPRSTADATDRAAAGARYELFVSLRDGMGTLQQALFNRVQPWARCLLNEPVTRVERIPPSSQGAAARYRVVSPSGTNEFDAVILAIPSYRAAELIAGWQPELAAELAAIEYASSVIAVTVHKLSDVAHPLDAYGLVVPARERRQILAVSFLSRKFPRRAPEGHVILRTFLGGALQPELCERDDRDVLSIVSASLEDIFGVRGAPEVTKIVRYPRGMPQYHVGHLSRVKRIEALQAATPGLYLCGNAYRGVGLPDCIHDAELAAEQATARQ